MPSKLRIIFMGTPEFSVGAFYALIKSGHEVVCVYSQPPRPKGRGQQVQKSPVHLAAETAGIEVRNPVNFKNADDVAAFAAAGADVAVVAAYGLILPKSILDAPKYGCINIHASLLPRWRGAAPIQRAILAGDDMSGITIMQMDAGLDTGPMIAMDKVLIDSKTTATSLHDALSDMGARLIVPVMNELAENGSVVKRTQPDEGVTYAHMLKKEEGLLDWSKDAQIIDRQVRALNPWPSTYTFNPQKTRMKILSTSIVSGEFHEQGGKVFDARGYVGCGGGTAIKLELIQPESKKPMGFEEALRGGYIKLGDVFQ